jgi:hypothetical protein
MTDRASAGRKAKRRGNEAELRGWKELVDDGYHVVLGRSGKTRDDIVDAVAMNKRLVRIIQFKGYELSKGEKEAALEGLDGLAKPPYAVIRELWEWDSEEEAWHKQLL